MKGIPLGVETHTEWVYRPARLPHKSLGEHRSATRGAIAAKVTGGAERARGLNGVVVTVLHNMRIKLTACGTLTHGKKRRRSHAAAYPQRWADKESQCGPDLPLTLSS